MIKCPFGLCNAVVELVPTQPQDTIKTHPLGGPPRLPAMNCPASLMSYPLSDAAKEALLEQYRDLAKQITRDIRPTPPTAAQQKGRRNLEAVLDELGRTDGPPPDPQIMKEYYRGPEPGDPAWQVGGRKDEDIIPEGEVRTGIIPLGVRGQSVGRGSAVNISELAGAVNGAGARCAEAQAAIGAALEALQRAMSQLQEVNPSNDSNTLNQYVGNLQNADRALNEAMGAITMGTELGQVYVGQIYI